MHSLTSAKRGAVLSIVAFTFLGFGNSHVASAQPSGTVVLSSVHDRRVKRRYRQRIQRSIGRAIMTAGNTISMYAKHAGALTGTPGHKCTLDAACLAKAGAKLSVARIVGVMVKTRRNRFFDITFLMVDVAAGNELSRSTKRFRKAQLRRAPGTLIKAFLAAAPPATKPTPPPKDKPNANPDPKADPKTPDPKADPKTNAGKNPQTSGTPNGNSQPTGTPSATNADKVSTTPVNIRPRSPEKSVKALKSARATIVHKNKMGGSFRLIKLIYALDGTQIFARSSATGTLPRTMDVLTGPIAPGSHTISVLAIYRGHGYGVFKYLNKYRFRVRSSHTFTASEGKDTRIEVIGFERGGITTPLEKRPAVKFKVDKSPGGGK